VLIAPIAWPIGGEVRVLTALWLGFLWLPFGFYMGRRIRRSGSAPSVRLMLGAGTVAALVTFALTVAAGLPRNHWSELAAAALGAWIGGAASSLRVLDRFGAGA